MQIDGKLLCWLCTLSYKRAIAKARQVETEGRLAKKRPSTEKQMKENHKKIHRVETTKQVLPEIPDKVARSSGGSMDPNSSDHVVAMTQLKEQIASLNKRLQQKDRELLAKDKQITELKGKNFASENDMRTQMKDLEKYYETKVDVLNKKLAGLLKEVAQLSKGNKKGLQSSAIKSEVKSDVTSKDSGGSGTDSPITN